MLPLQGIRVVEIGQNLAGPFGAAILGHLGAEVVKVERPGGDDARGWGPPFLNGSAAPFHVVNLNKRSITLDLKDPAAAAWLRDYLQEADVLLENLRPGSLAALGLGYEDLKESHPRLVYCSVTAFGPEGPMRNRPGYEPMVQAYSGLMHLSGTEDGPPIRIGTQVLDHGSAMWAAIGVLAALRRRDRTGRGGKVDADLFDTALGWLNVIYARYRVTGEPPARHPNGSRVVVPFQGFETSTGTIIVAAANNRLFAKLAAAIGRPEWADDPRYASNADRLANKEALIGELQAIFATESKGTWIDRLEAAGVPCAPVHTVPEVAALPQTAASGMIQPVPGLEDFDAIVLPLRFDGIRPPIRSRAPEAGEHTEEIVGRRAKDVAAAE